MSPNATTESLSLGERIALPLVLALSLMLRLSSLGVFITIDEPNWHARSIAFDRALHKSQLEDTYQSEHPGVVTMWLGAAAVEIVRARSGEKVVQATGPGVPPVTVWARRMMAVATWVGIGLAWLCLRALWGRRSAWLATALLALDPFYLAHSRFHHLDALLATLLLVMALSLGAHLRTGRRRYLILSSVAGGLALVQKSPGLYALAFGGGVWLWQLIRAWRDPTLRWRVLGRGALWLGIALMTAFAAWPALWVAPRATLAKMLAGGVAQGLSPHENSNFFWFHRRDNPGPLFYPVAWAFRTTPWVALGLAGLAVGRKALKSTPWRWPMFFFALGYALLMTASPKKFDRYLLPAFPALDVLAGLGWAALLTRIETGRPALRRALAPGAALLILAQVALIWPAQPYYLAYYNPLLGGTRTAPKVMLVGWGEGLERAAAYLNAKPEADRLHVSIQSLGEFKPFFRGQVTLAGYAPIVEPDYFVLYAGHVQRGFTPEVTGRLMGVEQPEYVVRVNGLEYAWVYANTIYRRETFTLLDQIAARDGPASVGATTVFFAGRAAMTRAYAGPLELRTLDGPARQDFVRTALQSAVQGECEMWLVRFPELHDDLAEAVEGALAEVGRPLETWEQNRVQVKGYAVDADARLVAAEPQVALQTELGGVARLRGYDLDATTLKRGDDLHLRLYWEALQPTDVSYTVFPHLVGSDGQVYAQADALPQGGGRPTTTWQPGEQLVDDYTLTLKPEAPPGAYALEIGMYDLSTMQRLPMVDAEGQRLPDDRALIEGVKVED